MSQKIKKLDKQWKNLRIWWKREIKVKMWKEAKKKRNNTKNIRIKVNKAISHNILKKRIKIKWNKKLKKGEQKKQE